MLDRVCLGRVSRKHHTVLRDDDGALLYEHCLTRQGFDGIAWNSPWFMLGNYAAVWVEHRDPQRLEIGSGRGGSEPPAGVRDEQPGQHAIGPQIRLAKLLKHRILRRADERPVLERPFGKVEAH